MLLLFNYFNIYRFMSAEFAVRPPKVKKVSNSQPPSSTSQGSGVTHVVIPPKWTPREDKDKPDLFSITSYNVLAQCLIRRELFSFASKAALKWPTRWPLLSAEIRAIGTDIFCMQEVDEMKMASCWAPLFDEMGYNIRFFGRTANHGLLIAYRRDMFEEVMYRELHMQRLRTTSRSEEEEFELDRGNRAQLLALRFTGKKRSNSGATSATNMEQQHEAKSEADSVDSEVASVRTVPTSGYEGVLITNTHLCWRYLLNFTKIRQVHLLLTAIQQVMNELHCQDETATAPANDSESHPQRNDEAVEQETKQMSQSMACRSRRPRYAVVSCGDFNTTTNTLALAFMMRRSLPSPFPVDASHSIYYSYARAREASNEELNSLGVANNSSSSSSLSSASSSPSSLTEYASAFPLACAISLGAPPAPVPRFSRITKEEAIEAVRSLKRQELSCSSVSTTASPDGESAVDNDDASSVFYSPSMANAPPVETLHELICGFEAAIPFTSSSPSLEPTSSSPASSSSLSSIPTPSPASGLSASRFFRACARFAGTRASEFADDYLCFLPPSLRTELVKHSEAMWTNKAKSILSSAAAEMEEDEFKTLFAGVDVDANELWSAEAEFEAGMLEEAWQASKDMIEATERLVRMDVTSPAAALRIPRGAAKTVPASTSTATTSTSTSASTPAADANGTMSTATATATAAAEAIVAVADMTLNGEELDSGEEPKVAPVTPKPADPVELRKMNARLMLQRLMDLFALEMHAKSLNWVPEYTSVYGHYQEYVPEAVTTSVTAMSGAESSSSSSSVPSSSSSSSSSSSVPSSSTSSSSPSLYSNKEFRLKELHHMGPRFTTYCPEFSSVLDYILVPMTTTTTTTTTAAAAAKRSSSSKSCSEEDGIKMQLRPVSLLHLPDLQELMKYVATPSEVRASDHIPIGVVLSLEDASDIV